MFNRYDKTYHISHDNPKRRLDKNQLKHLLVGDMIVEEKMDGSNTGIIRHSKGFALQRRNGLVGASEHEQFDFFNNWAHTQAYDRIMAVPKGFTIYGELLYAVHTLEYDSLPEYFLAFDIKENGEWLDFDERVEFCDAYGFKQVPFIARGTFGKEELLKLVPERSAYGPVAEGIVIKHYAKHGYFRGKIVKPAFQKALEESDHWMLQTVRKNKCISQ